MKLRLSLKGRPILTILVIAMLGVGLACAGEKATPTSPPTATLAPTATTAPTATLVPTATATLVPGAPTPTATAIPTATATAVPTPTVDIAALPWTERLMQSPGYKPEWGQPRTGGIIKAGMPKTPPSFNPNVGSTTPGPHVMLPFGSLLRFEPWVGQSLIIGDLAKSWEISGDGLTITMKLEEGVKFQDNPNVPAEYKGGKIRGDEFVCEDVQASVERHVRPPAVEVSITKGKAMLGHLAGVSCPDGPRGYTAALNFSIAKANTLASLSSGHMSMLDKEYIEWLNTEHPAELDKATPEKFKWLTGYGAWVPLEFQPDIATRYRRNPNHWREGLPLVDGVDLLILKDHTTRFTALATGNIHYFGHGSYSMLPGQVAQAERDFKDRIVVHNNIHNWGLGASINLSRAPYNDQRVRKAMYLALDRQEWQVFKKSGSYPGAVLTGFLAPRTQWGFTEEELLTWPGLRQPKDQDIAEANRLLDEVFGKGKRFSTTCLSDTVQTNMDTCMFFIEQMRRHLNINMGLETMENIVMSERTTRLDYDITGGSPGSTVVGDPDDWVMLFANRRTAVGIATKALLETSYKNDPVFQEAMEALIEAQSNELDPVKRREMTRKLDKMLAEEWILRIIFGWNVINAGTTPNLKGYVLTPFGTDSGWSHWERMWLAK